MNINRECLRIQVLELKKQVAEACTWSRTAINQVLRYAEEVHLLSVAGWDVGQMLTAKLYLTQVEKPVFMIPEYEYGRSEPQKSGVMLMLPWLQSCM